MSNVYTVSIFLLACITPPWAFAVEVCESAEDLRLRDTLKFVTEMELKSAEEETSAVMQVQLLQTSQIKKRGERLAPAAGIGHSSSALQTDGNQNSEALAVEVEEKPWGEAEKTETKPAAENAEAPSFLQVDIEEDLGLKDQQEAVPSPGKGSMAAPYPVKEHASAKVPGLYHRRRYGFEGPGTQLIHGAILLIFLFVMVCLLKVFTQVPQDWLGVKAGPTSGQGASPIEKKGVVRAHVENFDICSASDVGDLLPVASSYDCIFQKPVMSGKALRLEARIEGLSDGGTLVAPLTQRSCVLYSAVARCNKGPTPVKSSKAPNFVVSLIGSPLMQIEVEGQDVSLFDMCGGKWTCSQPLLEAAPHLQDFVVTHTGMDPENECETSSSLRALGPGVEFEERALLVGSTVTIVGELYRAPSGSLSLRPWRESALDELTDTIKPSPDSWENHGCKAATPLSDDEVITSSDEISPGKLLLSDHPGLLGSVVKEVSEETPEVQCADKENSSCKSQEVKPVRLNHVFRSLAWVLLSSKNAGGNAAKHNLWAAMWGNEDSGTFLSV